MTRSLKTMAGAALASATLIVAGCAAPVPPDTAYRRALETAIEAGRCDGPTVDALWSAYDRWYATAASLAYYHRASEAEALLRQGETFRLLGCPTAARAAFDQVLRRFPEPDYTEQRAYALQGLAGLAPAVPLLRPPSPAAARSAERPVFLRTRG